MRILFALHEHRIGAKIPLTLKRLVQLATLDGAVDLGIAEPDGLAHARQARRHHPGAHRRHQHDAAGDPYEALVSRAQPGNIDTVIVDGRILRQSGRFTALDHAQVLREAQEAAWRCAPAPIGRRREPARHPGSRAAGKATRNLMAELSEERAAPPGGGPREGRPRWTPTPNPSPREVAGHAVGTLGRGPQRGCGWGCLSSSQRAGRG